MRTYALIGRHLGYSFSSRYFSEKFLNENINDCTYINLEIDPISDLRKKISELKISGFNVTIPYKKQILPFLDFISKNAEDTKSVNTVKIINNKWYGYNTDIIGFQKSLTPILNNRLNALILGNGGASRSVQFVLNKLNVNFQIVSRNTDFDYHQISKRTIDSIDAIFNCTPLGTYPNICEYPKIPYNLLNAKHLLYDLVYNPEQTKFLTFGLKYECSIKNGKEMLILQAEGSWDIWNKDVR